MQSGTGIVTEHGILFVDEDVQFQELYDGQVFPPYLYDASILCTAKAEYHGKVEYLYLPCERAAIDKSIGRLGAPDAESVSIILDDFMVDNPEWMRRLREMTSSESIYDINDLVGAISNADMQLDKLTAVAEYAGVEDAKSITALANSLGLFTLIEGAEDNEDVGTVMSDKKAFAYFRVGNAEQLGEATDNRVFLYCRQSYDDSHFMNRQQEHLLRHCSDKGYRAEGSIIISERIIIIISKMRISF